MATSFRSRGGASMSDLFTVLRRLARQLLASPYRRGRARSQVPMSSESGTTGILPPRILLIVALACALCGCATPPDVAPSTASAAGYYRQIREQRPLLEAL